MQPFRYSRAVILFLLLCCASASAQRTVANDGSSLNFGFVSPNTRDSLKLEDAIRGMNSSEELDLLRQALQLECVVQRKITALRALGSWSDGAEHSILVRTKADEATIRYVMSRLGRDSNQKAVIYFHPQSNGRARIYVLYPPRRFRNYNSISRLLDQAGIAFRTLVPTRKSTRVYIIDTENNLTTKVRAAAKRLKARIRSQVGSASFVGDDSDREKGQTVFDREIKDYESKHPGLPPPCQAN